MIAVLVARLLLCLRGIPVYLPRQVHNEPQDDEQSDCAHLQRINLDLSVTRTGSRTEQSPQFPQLWRAMRSSTQQHNKWKTIATMAKLATI